jgi:hypothetical protein
LQADERESANPQSHPSARRIHDYMLQVMRPA